MLHIEIIGLEPPCPVCNELLANARKAVHHLQVAAVVEKRPVLADDVLIKYGLLLNPALALDGVIIAQGQSLTVEEIVALLGG